MADQESTRGGATTPLRTVLDYHERTKHRLDRYARGPETLDWDAQPDPFRRYQGAPLIHLPLTADRTAVAWPDLFEPGKVPPRPLDREAIGLLLEISFGLAAWKEYGPDRWAVRCNPSSGNLHPTEVYLLGRGIAGLPDGLHHYVPKEHGLEHRCALAPAVRTGEPRAWIAFSSIHWREAWKYGERAFRYCMLDAGHAIGALRYAAAVLGWTVRPVGELDAAALAHLLGLDRDQDFGRAEREDPDLLFELIPGTDLPALAPEGWTEGVLWQGQANPLDHRHLYHWPIIDAVAAATRPEARSFPLPTGHKGPLVPPELPPDGRSATVLLRRRRSAQQFDGRARQTAASFFRTVAALLPEAGLPWDAWPEEARVHPVLFAHRVDGLAPGAYVLPRSKAGETILRETLQQGLEWAIPEGCPEGLPLYRLAENPALPRALRTICCHQALGSEATFAVSMLAEFEPVLASSPASYRRLFQEAGLLGQVLYLEAEAAGLAGTGIGCFFDDVCHQMLGIAGRGLQSVYHFTVGRPLPDTRIATALPYVGRTA